MSRTKAVYAGSFDPVHFGHLDIIKRADPYAVQRAEFRLALSDRRGEIPGRVLFM
ncbi:MAG: hypothetical protein EBU46_11550, partial [Nitrosomonadaceae bacterium]|nr:hypothetical protein [Nitrosomonadaceae bacterium]